jgi:uridylate kinase
LKARSVTFPLVKRIKNDVVAVLEAGLQIGILKGGGKGVYATAKILRSKTGFMQTTGTDSLQELAH